MATTKTLAILAIAGLALSATACGSKAEQAAPATTAAPATSTTEKEPTTTEKKKTTTTEEAEEAEPSTTKVTKPVKVEKIEKADLPTQAQTLPTGFEFTADEEDCVDTVVYEYIQDPSNATDDATIAGVMGGAIAACVDQDALAAGIVASVKESAPELTATQADCLQTEIASADIDSLAVFLGSFIYEGPGAEEMQAPFLTALDEACGLSS